MEFLLYVWDEADDLLAAGRHLTTSAAAEITSVAAPLASVISALAVWALLAHARISDFLASLA